MGICRDFLIMEGNEEETECKWRRRGKEKKSNELCGKFFETERIGGKIHTTHKPVTL